jgi:hypothetical protein
MAKFIGIDPGAKGSLCCLDTDDLTNVEFIDTPADHASAQLVRGWVMGRTPNILGLEKVHAIFGTSAGSNFKFGYNVGVLTGVLYCTFVGIDLIPPKTWQKSCGIVFKPKSTAAIKKRVVADAALRLYPSAAIHGPRGGLLDGRSDALMIAHHMMLKYGGSNG